MNTKDCKDLSAVVYLLVGAVIATIVMKLLPQELTQSLDLVLKGFLWCAICCAWPLLLSAAIVFGALAGIGWLLS